MEKNDIDILTIDQQIIDKFNKEKQLLSDYKSRLDYINKSLQCDSSLKNRILSSLVKTKEELEKKIYDIENDNKLNLYKAETIEILDKYKEVINTPIKPSFIGPPKPNKEKKNIINEYLKVASNYIDIDWKYNKKDILVCKNCNKKDFDITDSNIYICNNCSAQQVVLKNISSYRDIDRVNGSARYQYVRRVHFRDAINQYQAKQNSTISNEVYKNIEIELERHGLLNTDCDPNDKLKKYSSVTKEHIRIFLQELDYTNHYENINLIHYTLTGKKPDDISHLEEKLLQDFDTLTDLYDKLCKNLERKSFINTQYVLYQLLLRHKHKCNKEDFTILKTIDRQNFHDQICQFLFDQLNWNMVPFF